MNQCVCRVFGIFLVVFLYTAFTVEGADVTYGNTCVDGTDTCTGTGTYACISSSCACAINFFRNGDGDACLAKVGLDGTCDSTDSATDQCSVTNTACESTENKCLCTSNFFSDGTACQTKIVYGAACSNTVADTTQCAVANQECSLESGTTDYKCQCTADYYGDGSSACVARKNPDDTGCAADQCVAHATCDLTATPTICECDAGYTATPTTTPTMCSGVVKFASLSYMYVIPILVSLMFLVR